MTRGKLGRPGTIVGVLALACLAVGLAGLPGQASARTTDGGHGRHRDPKTEGEIGPALRLTNNGRHLRPAGELTSVGNFPTGGALTADGRFFWAVDSGHGHDDVQVVDVQTHHVVQTLPLPGAYGGIAFSPDGTTAYVSGEPKGNSTPTGPTVANGGDAVHVFAVDAAT